MASEGPMTEEDLQARRDEAQEIAEEASAADPSSAPWGLEAYGDAPGGIGGGVGGFLWFETREAMLDFCARLLTFYNPGPRNKDHGEVAGRAAEVVAAVASGAESMDRAMERLNAVLRGFSQLRWWGEYSDLLHGSGEFQQDVRAWARESDYDDAEDADRSPIRADEEPTFREALTEWGF